MDSISENNPYLDKMQERGWAWIIKSADDKYGAPFTDDGYAAGVVGREHPFDEGEPLENVPEQEVEMAEGRLPGRAELAIITWD